MAGRSRCCNRSRRCTSCRCRRVHSCRRSPCRSRLRRADHWSKWVIRPRCRPCLPRHRFRPLPPWLQFRRCLCCLQFRPCPPRLQFRSRSSSSRCHPCRRPQCRPRCHRYRRRWWGQESAASCQGVHRRSPTPPPSRRWQVPAPTRQHDSSAQRPCSSHNSPVGASAARCRLLLRNNPVPGSAGFIPSHALG